jgi:hypothetical protein
MALEKVNEQGITFAEGRPGEALVRTVRDVTLIVEGCFSVPTRAALLYSSNLTPSFFDVSSLEAGEVLQKLRNYRLRLAVVVEHEAGSASRRFHELLEAERRDGHFGVFADRAAAVAWLVDKTPAGERA